MIHPKPQLKCITRYVLCKGERIMIVRFEVLELYIKNCIKNGLNPTWHGLKLYQR